MKKVVLSTAVMTFALTAPGLAQIEGIYIPPQCEIDTRHFLAKQAEQYVKAASEARSPEDKERSIQDAYRTVQDAVTRGEEGNGAIWYFLARTYVLDYDYAGADSALTRASALLPECQEDVDSQRYNMWVPVYNDAVTALRAEDYVSALPRLVDANAIYHEEPNVPFYMAQIYASNGESDSGIVYFKETLDILGDNADTTYAGMYDVAVFNTARLYHQLAEWDSAATWYAAYRELKPDDLTSLQALAGVLEFAGRSDEAQGYYAEIVDRAADLDAQTLFGTGVSLFQGSQYELAARAFSAGLEKNAFFRDGWYNLGQSYFALANPVEAEGTEPTPEELTARTEYAQQMLTAAVELEKVDPLNVSSLQMVVQAYHLLGEDDSTAAVIDRLNAMEYEFVVTSFTAMDGGFDMSGEIVNVKDEAVEFPGMTVNFINAAGVTVTSDMIPAASLAAQGSAGDRAMFNFTPMGEGLVAWLYEAPTGN